MEENTKVSPQRDGGRRDEEKERETVVCSCNKPWGSFRFLKLYV